MSPTPALGNDTNLAWTDRLALYYLQAPITAPRTSAAKRRAGVRFRFPVTDPQISPEGSPIGVIALNDEIAGPSARLIFCTPPDLTPRVVDAVAFPVADFQWSPRGRKVALLRQNTGTLTSSLPGPEHLYIYDTKTRLVTPLVMNHWVCRQQWGWSSDGRSIYYAERVSGGTQAPNRIWQIDAATQTQRLLVDFGSSARHIQLVRVAPDGMSMLVISQLQEQRELTVLDLRQAKWWTVAKGNLWQPAWSPKGNMFAVAVNGVLWTVRWPSLYATRVHP